MNATPIAAPADRRPCSPCSATAGTTRPSRPLAIGGAGGPRAARPDLLAEPPALRPRLVDRRELQPRVPRPADQPLLRQPGRRSAGRSPVRSGVGLGLALLVGRDARAGWPRSSIPVGDRRRPRPSCSAWRASARCSRGSTALRRYWFAIVFLVFMVPLPVALYATIASPLQLLVSQVATVGAERDGRPRALRGEHDDPARRRPDVRGRGVQRDAAVDRVPRPDGGGGLPRRRGRPGIASRVVASAVPIAMTANVARVILTGYIMYFFNPKYASGAYHTRRRAADDGLRPARCSRRRVLGPRPDRRADRVATARRERPAGGRRPDVAEPTWSSRPSSRASAATVTDPERRDRAMTTMSPMRRVVLCGVLLAFGLRRAGRPGGADADRAAAARGARWRRSRWSWATGSAATSRSTPTILDESQATTTSTAVYETGRAPGVGSGSGSTTRRRGLTCGIRPRSACRRGAGPRSSRSAGCSPIAAARRRGRCRSPGWATRKVNWSRASGSGTTSSARAGWSSTSGACRSPAGAATAGRPAGSGMTVEVFCPGETDPDGEALQRLRRPPARGPRADPARGPGRVLHPVTPRVDRRRVGTARPEPDAGLGPTRRREDRP